MNTELLNLVVKTIEADPAHWDQNYYRTVFGDERKTVDSYQGQLFRPVTCNTSFCFAGWAIQLGSVSTPHWVDSYYLLAEPSDDPAELMGGIVSACARAQKLLGLTAEQAEDLFHATNSLGEIKTMVAKMIEANRSEAA